MIFARLASSLSSGFPALLNRSVALVVSVLVVFVVGGSGFGLIQQLVGRCLDCLACWVWRLFEELAEEVDEVDVLSLFAMLVELVEGKVSVSGRLGCDNGISYNSHGCFEDFWKVSHCEGSVQV